jgi:glycosyltransferase involved in cell wall biosynthesis
VFASRTETQGLVLLEALALGVPVVSTAVMGTADVLRGARGAVVAPEDEHAFAAAVAGVLGDAALRARLAAAGPADAARWSAEALASRLAELYRELATARGARRPSARPAIAPAG